MAISVKYYTNKYVAITILIIMAIWALLFYAFLMDEVYDNVDDGLKNQKIEIIREAYDDPSIVMNNQQYGINQFRILPAQPSDNLDKNHFSRELMYMPYDDEDEPYRILKTGFYTKDGKAYSLEIRTSTVEEDDYLINLAIALSVLYLVIVLSILLINHFIMGRAWRPFHHILRSLSNYRFGNKTSFSPVQTGIKEFQELNGQIEKMIQRNEDVFVEQKRFLENASHELQTPLAITIGKLDLLLQEGNLEEGQLVKIAEAKQSLHRMVALNKSLLMLSRIENNQYSDTQEVDFNALTHELLDDLHDLIEFRNIQLNVQEMGKFKTDINPELARILLSNLLRNAIKYNVEGGQIAISLNESAIDIANDSKSTALNPDFIFARFHKGMQDNQSNGLGLSIVQSILEHHKNLQISYAYTAGMQQFTLKK